MDIDQSTYQPVKLKRRRRKIYNKDLYFKTDSKNSKIFHKGHIGTLVNKRGYKKHYKVIYCSTAGIGALKSSRMCFRKIRA